jgi:hypothetical protein
MILPHDDIKRGAAVGACPVLDLCDPKGATSYLSSAKIVLALFRALPLAKFHHSQLFFPVAKCFAALPKEHFALRDLNLLL